MIGQNYQSKKLAIKEGHNLKKYIHKNPQDFDKLVLQLKRIRRLMTDPFWGHFFREGYCPVAARLLGGKEVRQKEDSKPRKPQYTSLTLMNISENGVTFRCNYNKVKT